MREIYPPHYAAFHCIAGACPDSCCKEWEIVVDAESVEKYQMVSGELGNRLRQAMITDADGDVIFQEREKRCPFWNAQQLCDIHGGLGEAALCETCRQFPRVTQDYGDFIEYDISPACPEAARLLMELTPEQWLLSENDCPEVTGSFPEYDGKIMQQRKDQRRILFACLQDTSVPALKQISHCLELVTQWTDFSEGTSDAICMKKQGNHYAPPTDSKYAQSAAGEKAALVSSCHSSSSRLSPSYSISLTKSCQIRRRCSSSCIFMCAVRVKTVQTANAASCTGNRIAKGSSEYAVRR